MKIVIYGTPHCVNCGKIKQTLTDKSIEYEYKTIGEDVSKEEVELLVGRMIRSVPIIIVDNHEINPTQLNTIIRSSPSDPLGGISM